MVDRIGPVLIKYSELAAASWASRHPEDNCMHDCMQSFEKLDTVRDHWIGNTLYIP